jgi:hypothetical protein
MLKQFTEENLRRLAAFAARVCRARLRRAFAS